MTGLDRLAVASRVFSIAAILGLGLVTLDPVAIQGTVVLAAISGAAVAVGLTARVPLSWVTSSEALLAGLVIGFAYPQGLILLPYLVIPALLAGLVRGPGPVLVVVAAETMAISSLLVLAGGLATLTQHVETVAPWLVTALGVGLLGAWLRQLRADAGHAPPDTSYESARRLLTQLRTVARRLSSGLDTGNMSAQLLATVGEHLPVNRAVVLVRTEGGVLAPLGYSGAADRATLDDDDPVVESCWAEMEPATGITSSGLASRRYRIALPLRVGSRMIGMVLTDCGAAPDRETLKTLMVEIDDHSMRLDTALIFDEIRSLATVEERRRLAREIHDGVAQEIASLGYVVDEIGAGATSAEQKQRLLSLRRELSRVVSELRLSIFDLRSEINPSAGLGSALSDYVREVGARSEMTVHLTLDEAPTRLRSEVETELLRIAQEAVTNARKHSAARNLWVDCRIRPPYARIEVRDDGCGGIESREGSYGLRIMRERAKRIDGTLEVDHPARRDDAGTTVVVMVGSEPVVDPHSDLRTAHERGINHHSGSRR